jgi:hypothetical protein
MSTDAQHVVSKAGNFAHVLRDDGVSYHEEGNRAGLVSAIRPYASRFPRPILLASRFPPCVPVSPNSRRPSVLAFQRWLTP